MHRSNSKESNTAHTHQVTVRTRTMLAVVRVHEHLTSIYVCVSNPMYEARECCTTASLKVPYGGGGRAEGGKSVATIAISTSLSS